MKSWDLLNRKKNDFKQRLKFVMARNNLTSSEVCKATGIAKSTFSQYLSGRNEARAENLTKLANFFQVSEAWLEGYDTPMRRPYDYSSLEEGPYGSMMLINEIQTLQTKECGAMEQINFEKLFFQKGPPIIAPFDKRLAEAMRVRGLRNVDLCRITHTSKGLISQYLQGSCEPRAGNLFALAEALRVNPAWLWGYDAPMDADGSDYNQLSPIEENKDCADDISNIFMHLFVDIADAFYCAAEKLERQETK